MKKTSGGFQITGEATLKVIRPDGVIIKHRINNLVVQWSLDALAASLLGTPLPNPITYLAMGDNSTPAALGDTSLGNELRRDLASVAPIVGEPNKLQYEVIHAQGAVTGTFREAGLFDLASGGNMFNRMTFGDLVVGALDTLQVVWIITVRNA